MVGEYPPVMASETDMALPPGFQNGFDKYSNFRPMGKGGRADILACRDTALGRTVAMKQLQAKYADNSQLRRRFLREARLTAQLQHPNTVPVYEIGYQQDGELYFTMKKVAGRIVNRGEISILAAAPLNTRQLVWWLLRSGAGTAGKSVAAGVRCGLFRIPERRGSSECGADTQIFSHGATRRPG